MMREQRGTATLIGNSDQGVEVKAILVGALAVHRRWTWGIGSRRDWIITHRKSGLRVHNQPLPTQRSALRVARLLDTRFHRQFSRVQKDSPWRHFGERWYKNLARGCQEILAMERRIP